MLNLTWYQLAALYHITAIHIKQNPQLLHSNVMYGVKDGFTYEKLFRRLHTLFSIERHTPYQVSLPDANTVLHNIAPDYSNTANGTSKRRLPNIEHPLIVT